MSRVSPRPGYGSQVELESGQCYSGEHEFRPAKWNKKSYWRFNLMRMAGADSQSRSFEELALPLFDRLYNFACWLTQDRGEAEDLVQETYVKALKGFGSFQMGTNFRAWMFRILRNTFLTSRTGLRVHMEVPVDAEEEGSDYAVETQTPESILVGRSDSEVLRRCIEALPVHHREIILLCEVEEMSYREIAEALSIPIGTVMSRLSRARKILRQGLSLQLQKG